MVQLTRIYTRGGDKGKTSLGDGTRVPKHAPRIDLMGTVDEVNSAIGLARLSVNKEMDASLSQVQHDLFDMGADLCLPTSGEKPVLRIQDQHTDRLEKEIDCLNSELQPLTSFVLPGGSAPSAALHFARTLTRRAERQVSEHQEDEGLNPEILRYLNRLSDYLFVLARYLNDKGEADILWTPGKNIKS